MRRGAAILGTVMVITCPAATWAQWDLMSGVAVTATWADNVDYAGKRDVRQDPNDPNRIVVVNRDPDGDALTSLRLRGTASYQGPRWHFNGNYEPMASFYRDRTDLNHQSHAGRISSIWNMTRNVEFNVTDRFMYSPEQGTRAESVSTPVLITDYSDRRSNTFGASVITHYSDVGRYSLGVTHGFQRFSNPDLVDFTGGGVNAGWARRLSGDSEVELRGAAHSNRFNRQINLGTAAAPDPRTVRNRNRSYRMSCGGSMGMGRRLVARGLLGYDLVVPDDRDRKSSRGLHADAALQVQGRRVGGSIGYNRALSAGSGAFAVSETETYYGNVTARFTDYISGNLFVNQSYSERAGSASGSDVRTTSGGASMEVRFGQRVSGRLMYNRNDQNGSGNRSRSLTHNRVTLGLVARID